MAKVIKGYLGIDNGTQGVSIIFTDESLRVLATGEGGYDFVPGLADGCYEQLCEDWDKAVSDAMNSIRKQLAPSELDILSIGISGQMHGEVLVGKSGEAISSVRLWCDSRNEMEGHEMTEVMECKVPKRATAARFLWTARNRPDLAAQVAHLTTPAGWIAYRLTGEFTLGIGDSAGMFPINTETLDFDKEKLDKFDLLVGNEAIPSLATILPKVRKAGEDAGSLNESGAALLGTSQTGVPVAAGEGDQVAALAGSLIGKPGTVACSFGTSVCANAVGDRPFQGVSPAVDHFCAADGLPINMVCLRNGTTFLNTVVESFGGVEANDKTDAFAAVMPQMIKAPTDCGGLLALPFMDDEPGLKVSQGGTAMIIGWRPDNASPGNVAKAALLSAMFNLRLGCEVLDKQGYPRTEVVLTGGLTKTPESAQILADVFDSPVTLLSSADEGCSWGAAVLAKYRYLRATEKTTSDFPTFLNSVASSERKTRFEPNGENVPVYQEMFERYQRLIKLVPQINNAIE